ncbi:MAG: Maf family protein [Alphaproteobacteria bacterium]
MSPPLVLASASAVRRRLLEQAGVPFRVRPAGVDEAGVIASLRAEEAAPRHVADLLAELKAVQISRGEAQAFTLGADQVLVLDGELFQKPEDIAGARAHLRRLRGKTHELLTAAVLAREGAPIWRHVAVSKLTMRPFSDEFLESYLARNGEAVLASVGAYFLEEEGVQLFSRIDGDYFSILGLPMLPLLDILRRHGVVPS